MFIEEGITLNTKLNNYHRKTTLLDNPKFISLNGVKKDTEREIYVINLFRKRWGYNIHITRYKRVQKFKTKKKFKPHNWVIPDHILYQYTIK